MRPGCCGLMGPEFSSRVFYVDDAQTLLIEGWRFLPHSYAIVNQFQILELLKQPSLRLVHRDMPLPVNRWVPAYGLFEAAEEERLKAIAVASARQSTDAVLRITFPYHCEDSVAPRTCVFGTSEFGCVPKQFIAGGLTLAQALAESQTQIITPSQWSRNGFIHSGAPPERVTVVPHGVDPTVLRPLEAAEREARRASSGLTGFTFLTIGSLTGNKGLPLLLKAFAEVILRYPEVRLVIKGLESLYPSLQLLRQQGQSLTDAEMERVSNRMIYTGETLSYRTMASLYQCVDAYVSPYSAEGFNLPVLEAVACGLPVICTAGGSTDDFTRPDFALRIASKRLETSQNGVQGWSLEPSLDHLIAQMCEVVENEKWVRTARVAGPAWVANGYTWAQVTERLLRELFPSGLTAKK